MKCSQIIVQHIENGVTVTAFGRSSARFVCWTFTDVRENTRAWNVAEKVAQLMLDGFSEPDPASADLIPTHDTETPPQECKPTPS